LNIILAEISEYIIVLEHVPVACVAFCKE